MAEEPRSPAEDDSTSGGGSSPSRPSPGSRSDEATSASWHRMSGVGVEFIAALGLFAGLGWWLDGKFGTTPWLLIAGGGLGFAVGLWNMLKIARRMMK